jgi:hypothetical protein
MLLILSLIFKTMLLCHLVTKVIRTLKAIALAAHDPCPHRATAPAKGKDCYLVTSSLQAGGISVEM